MVSMIRQPIDDTELLAQLSGLEADGLSIFTLGGSEGPSGGEARGAIVNASRLVNEMRANHGLGILETLILGQAYIAALLMASALKDRDSISIRVDCSGPAKGLSVEGSNRPAAENDGAGQQLSVHGSLFEEHIPLDRPLESFDTAPFFGSGSLTVTRFIEGAPRPFSGGVPLKSGRLAEDLASYYLESEQTRTALSLSIQFDSRGRAVGAGGLSVQALPGARPDFMDRVEAALVGSGPIGKRFSTGASRSSLLASCFGPGESMGLLLREALPVSFDCDCSRERFEGILRAASPELLAELASKGPWPVEMVCHNCGSKYEFTRDEIRRSAIEGGLGGA
jgi:molecular chaperone Hsp33